MRASTILWAAILVDLSLAVAVGRPRRHRRQSPSQFNPNPASGFDDPILDIADPASGLAIQAGYLGPQASDVDQELIGPVNLLRNGHVNFGPNATFTLPLYPGMSASNQSYWYIVTDTSDQANAAQLGLNFASKLRYAAQSLTPNGLLGAEQVTIVNDTIYGRQGLVDFSPVLSVVPGNSTPFPPASVQPGSVGDALYTPLIQITNSGYEIYDAPIIAGDVTDDYLNQFCNGVPQSQAADFYSKVHDRVVAICPSTQTVTLDTVRGFSFGKSVLYMVLEAADNLTASLNMATYAPRMGQIESGDDDALFSGTERFFVSTNGFTNADLPPGAPNNETHHPFRQGLDSAILGEGDPINVLGTIPTLAFDYSPIWNIFLFTWTDYAIRAGLRTRLTAEFEVLGLAAAGYLTNPDGSPFSNLGILANCPIVHRFL